MNITIHVTASGAKRLLFVGAILIILGTAAVCFAVPVTFQSGTVLKAADLNQDFSAATTATHGTKTYSLGAVFKKATQPIYSGNLGGYAGAKAICESIVGSATAHMCTAEELVRSAQLGDAALPSGGWYAPGVFVSLVGLQGSCASSQADDCQGWTYNKTTQPTACSSPFGQYAGALWNASTSSAYPSTADCSTTHAVLCCD